MASLSHVDALKRKVLIVLIVVALHSVALWTMQTGSMQHKVELTEPPEIVLKFIAPFPPPAAPAPLAPSPPPPVKHRRAKSEAPAQPETSASRQIAAPPAFAPSEPTPLPAASVDRAVPAPLTGATTGAPAAIATVAPPLPIRIEPPSSAAGYLQNAKPSYPALSRRLGEQGKVVLRVLIGVEGRAQKAEIKQSSGFDRLDQAALRTVLDWRYVPGKHAGVPQAMWFDVPISFVLE